MSLRTRLGILATILALALVLYWHAGSLVLYWNAGNWNDQPDERPVALREREIPALPAPPQSTYYSLHVRPILVTRCAKCHGPQRQDGGLRVDTVAALQRGGVGGPAVVAGRSVDSPIVLRMQSGEMPLGGPRLEEAEVNLVRRWIDSGAEAPTDDVALERLEEHWAFRPIMRYTVPAGSSDAAEGNAIDAFLDVRRQAGGITPLPEAEPSLLLRRLTIDLTGLPPSLADYDEFLKEPTPVAYDRVVERLLASPAYAERWARHWMDILRYTGHDGRLNARLEGTVHYSSPKIWTWREWLIRSFAADKGFDRMVLEMIAGDELPGGTDESVAGTGYLVANTCHNDRELSMNAILEHLPRAFLGITLGCARCHDHKFDPISQKDYYRLRAIFEPCRPVDASTYARVASDQGADYATSYLLENGDPRRATMEPLSPGVPASIGSLAPYLPAKSIKSSHGYRLALARWMVSDANPLAARVAVNHVWLRHFGRGLVATPSEFGTRGAPPTDPELLDWLASEFRTHDWSLKWLHRLVVRSAAYKMASSGRDSSTIAEADPDNRLYCRFGIRQMEAEVVRDSLLYMAGRLSRVVGGPDTLDTTGTSERRSMYLRATRVDRVKFLDVFNAPRVEECYERETTISPQQALAAWNSELAWEAADKAARGLDGSDDFVSDAFLLVLGRAPTRQESDLALTFLAAERRAAESEARQHSERSLRALLLHSLINTNDFVSVR